MPDPISMDELELLRQARDKAHKLLENLLAQRDDLDRNAPQLPPEQRALGQQAFDKAIASARRTVQGIEDALACTNDQPE